MPFLNKERRLLSAAARAREELSERLSLSSSSRRQSVMTCMDSLHAKKGVHGALQLFFYSPKRTSNRALQHRGPHPR